MVAWLKPVLLAARRSNKPSFRHVSAKQEPKLPAGCWV